MKFQMVFQATKISDESTKPLKNEWYENITLFDM